MSIRSIEDRCFKEVTPIDYGYFYYTDFDFKCDIVQFTKPREVLINSTSYNCCDPRVTRTYWAQRLDDKIKIDYDCPLDDLCMEVVKIRHHRDFPKTLTGEDPIVAVIDGD